MLNASSSFPLARIYCQRQEPIENVHPLLEDASVWAAFSYQPLPAEAHPVSHFLSNEILAESSWWFFTPTHKNTHGTLIEQKLQQSAPWLHLMQHAHKNLLLPPAGARFLIGSWVLQNGTTLLGILSPTWHQNTSLFYTARKPSEGVRTFFKTHAALAPSHKEPIQSRWISQRLLRMSATHSHLPDLDPIVQHLQTFRIEREQAFLSEHIPTPSASHGRLRL